MELTRNETLCWLLGAIGPQTREELLYNAWCMWTGRADIRLPAGKEAVANTFIRPVNRVGRHSIYELTPAGEQVAWEVAIRLAR